MVDAGALAGGMDVGRHGLDGEAVIGVAAVEVALEPVELSAADA